MAKGIVHKFGDNIDTAVIIPARYLNAPSPEELAKHCMEDIDPTFASRVKPGEIIVGGANFGCGSSREHAPIAIQAAGVSCVIAINIGFPILECPEAAAAIAEGDVVSVDFSSGTITDETTGARFQATAFPEFIARIIEKGGLLPYLKARQEAQK